MTFLWAILIGLVLGVIRALFTSRRDPGSIVVRAIIGILCGIVSAVVVAIVLPEAASYTGIAISAGGVVVLLFVYWLIVGNRKKR